METDNNKKSLTLTWNEHLVTMETEIKALRGDYQKSSFTDMRIVSGDGAVFWVNTVVMAIGCANVAKLVKVFFHFHGN